MGSGTWTRANGAVVASSTATVAPRAGFSPTMKGQRVDGRRRSARALRGATEVVSQALQIGARAVGGLARLRELFGARAFLQFAQVRFGFTQAGFGGTRRRPTWRSASDLLTRLRATRSEQPVAFAHGIVALRRGRVSRRATAARMVVARGPFLSSSTRASASASCARAASSSAVDSARSCTTMTSPAFTVAPSANGSATMDSFASATSSTRSRSSVPGRVLSSWRAQAASRSDACERR